ncbi:putative clathrin assembly protein At4g40080 [Magnolia sinica]|uniref:putative clathrin assembly protein At4g40080 n=1 Tax=Magnolia sinica TaxID=86752 RepID=UPI0026588E15|nr:putative clathrin assembly protein At4g40080 [Magnolia sinica]
MGRRQRPILKNLLGALKDRASQSKAALLSGPNTSSPHLAVLRATTHDPSSPPREKHVSVLLSFGHGSRLTASCCVEAIMDRLHGTGSSSVALKCLIAIHNIVRRGTFILQDQLSIYPSAGGRNYLNLSNFRDDSSPEAWQVCLWVRWYARVLEQILFSSRILGSFLSSSLFSSFDDGFKETKEEVSALPNGHLLKEFDALVGVVEEICKVPEYAHVRENRVVAEVIRLVGEDNLMAQREILVRAMEMRERLSCLVFSDSVELVCVLKRLENCKEKLLFLSSNEKMKGGDALLDLVGEMKERIGAVEKCGERRLVRKGKVSESARLDSRVVVKSSDLVRFSSGRMELLPDSVM